METLLTTALEREIEAAGRNDFAAQGAVRNSRRAITKSGAPNGFRHGWKARAVR
ncbi:MAG: hypothetical protein ACLS7Z_08380 [Christensenellales bacterium]